MKRYLGILIFITVLFLTQASRSFANVLYSNDFTSTYTGFNETYGTCSPSQSGLTCSGTDSFYTTNFPTLKCVSADMKLSNVRDGLFFADGVYTSWIGFAASGSLQTSDGHLHVYATNPILDSDLGINTPSTDNFHNYEICKSSDMYTFYFDSLLVDTQIYPNHAGEYFGFEAKPGTVITNFIATDTLPSPPPTNTPTPTLTPTPSPSPTPTSAIHLNVPMIKQTSSPWQSLEYDSARIWSPLDKTIHDWGCALTSAVMVLQYNGIVKMPDNSPFNPASLNTWLKSQSDGYIGNGLVNWVAIARLTKIIKLAFNNPNFTADALEYKRPTAVTTSQLVTDLTNNIPDILEEPGHFVVGTGTQSNTFTINDPFFSRNTLSDGYNNTFLSLGKYVPSHTDLSYILITGDPSLTFTLYNSANQSIGSTYIQQPLINDTNNTSSGSPLKIFYVEQPANEQYILTVTSSGQNQPFSFNEYLYDKSGNVTTASVTGRTNSSGQFTTHVVSKKVTFQTLLTDLQNAFQLNLLPQGAYIALKAQIEDVQREVEKGKITVAKVHLTVLSVLINILPKITTGAKNLLQSDIGTLLQNL